MDWFTGFVQEGWELGERTIGPWSWDSAWSEVLTPSDMNYSGDVHPTESIRQMAVQEGINSNPFNRDSAALTAIGGSSALAIRLASAPTPVTITAAGVVIAAGAYRNFADHSGRSAIIFRNIKTVKID